MDELLLSILKKCEEVKNLIIFDSFIKATPKIKTNRKIVCSISGGADSDIMLDILTKLDTNKKIKYVFFDTGIEYQATKEHLDYLERKYGVVIDRVKAITPVPLGCRKYGVPFWSKHVSEMIERLQRHGFKWEDKPFDELYREYPKCKVALQWWCNQHAKGAKSPFNISNIRGLKEYMIANPPTFRISNKCCKGAKKDNAKKYLKENNADLNVVGIRRAEGGTRAAAYKTCFDIGELWDNYRPIFWFSDNDKLCYENLFEITHSACYEVYGLKRTGCAGCPFGKDFETELEIIQKYEPKLYNAVIKIFGESYEYTRNFYRFREAMKGAKQCTN